MAGVQIGSFLRRGHWIERYGGCPGAKVCCLVLQLCAARLALIEEGLPRNCNLAKWSSNNGDYSPPLMF